MHIAYIICLKTMHNTSIIHTCIFKIVILKLIQSDPNCYISHHNIVFVPFVSTHYITRLKLIPWYKIDEPSVQYI